MAKKKHNSGLDSAVAAPAFAALQMDPVEAEMEWLTTTHRLQEALRAMKLDPNARVILSELPLPRNINLTGPDTVQWKRSVIRTVLRDLNASREAFRASTNAKTITQAIRSQQKAQLSSQQKPTVSLQQKPKASLQQKTRASDPVTTWDRNYYRSGGGATGRVENTPQKAVATSTHRMPLRSHYQADNADHWTPPTFQKPDVAKAATLRESQALASPTKKERKRARLEAARLEEVAAARRAQIHSRIQELKEIGEKSAKQLADAKQKTKPPAQTYATPARETQLSTSAEADLAQPRLLQPNQKPSPTPLPVLRAKAALGEKAERRVEEEPQREPSKVTEPALPLRPASRSNRTGLQYEYTAVVEEALPPPSMVCSNRLSAPAKPHDPVHVQQITLHTKAERQKKPRLAEECCLVRKDCINKLSRPSPNDSAADGNAIVRGKRHNPNASLLGLPDKIQEQIYRMVLIRGGPIYIIPSSHEQPALLRTCKQLRVKTRPIFENFNSFRIKAVDCRPVVPKNYITHWSRHVTFEVQTSGFLIWGNLKKWLEAYHERRVPRLRTQAGDDARQWNKCMEAFEIVRSRRALFPHMTFEEMVPMLEAWKEKVTARK